jgi:hypothetical protein
MPGPRASGDPTVRGFVLSMPRTLSVRPSRNGRRPPEETVWSLLVADPTVYVVAVIHGKEHHHERI